MKSHSKIILSLGIVAFVWPVVAEARSLQEVACEEAKLGRLAHRFSTPGQGDNLFLWSSGSNRFSGLGVSNPFLDLLTLGVRDERQLAFDVTLNGPAGLLNPRRLLLPQVNLVRVDPASNLSATERVMGATFELAPEVIDPSIPQQGLTIAGRLGSSYGSASGAGRALALDDLFERCPGEENSPFDLEVFEILSRTLRVTPELLQPLPGPGIDNYRILLFRDLEPLAYRAKVVRYSTIEGFYSEASYQLRLHMALDAAGKLAPGRIQALPWCRNTAPPCTELIAPETAVLIAPPLFAGHEVQTAEQFWSGAFLNIPVEDSPDNVLSDDVPWPDLLRGTAWDRPVGVP